MEVGGFDADIAMAMVPAMSAKVWRRYFRGIIVVLRCFIFCSLLELFSVFGEEEISNRGSKKLSASPQKKSWN